MPLTKRAAEKLVRDAGGTFVRAGSNHDIWLLPDGTRVAIPRHPGDLSPGVERDIKRKLGLS